MTADLPPGTCWRAIVHADEVLRAAVALAMDDCLALTEFQDHATGTWLIEALYADKPGAELEVRLALAAIRLDRDPPPMRCEPVLPADWVARVHDSLPPRRIGRFYIRGSHVEGPSPPGSIPLHIDATAAFGSGEHETTRGCLIMLEALAQQKHRPRRVVDLGCGTGILGIAAPRLWRVRVLAIDIDPDSVRATREAARRNHVLPQMTVARGDGPDRALLRRAPRPDLILANILARPLRQMAPALAARLAPGGLIVLAGLLRAQEIAVSAAYRRGGLRPVARLHLGPWAILMLQRPLDAEGGRPISMP